MIYLLTAIEWTPGGSSAVHTNTQNNTMIHNTQNIRYIPIIIHKRNNKNT
jgi:hypothetical protein